MMERDIMLIWIGNSVNQNVRSMGKSIRPLRRRLGDLVVGGGDGSVFMMMEL
jgi:hypothetical protein